jgi:hypothetical protein
MVSNSVAACNESAVGGGGSNSTTSTDAGLISADCFPSAVQATQINNSAQAAMKNLFDIATVLALVRNTAATGM